MKYTAACRERITKCFNYTHWRQSTATDNLKDNRDGNTAKDNH